MPNQLILPSNLQNKLFSTQKAVKNGLGHKGLHNLTEHHLITRLARGIYCQSDHDLSEEDQAILATMIVGKPSALCLLSALSHHQLTDIIPKATWIMVPNKKRTQHSKLRIFRTINPRWTIGIQKENGYQVTDVDRTLVDCLTQKRLIGTQTAIEALRQAIKNKNTTLDRVLKMAARLKVAHRIIPYIEALA